MARITRNTFDETINRKKVVFQYGVPFVDNEPNEAEDIVMAEATAGIRASMTNLRATDETTDIRLIRFGYAQGTDWQPFVSSNTGGSTFHVSVMSGELFVDGYRIVLPATIDLSTVGLTFGTGSDTFGYVYMDVVLAEVNSGTDPSMATPNVGETTVRDVLTVTWHKASSAVSFAAAYSSISSPLPIVMNPRIYKGNTARIFLFKYQAVSTGAVSSLVKTAASETMSRRKYLKTFRWGASATAKMDGMVVWNSAVGILQIGGGNFGTGFTPWANSTEPYAARGMMLRSSNAPDHLFDNAVENSWTLNGTANFVSNGNPVPDWGGTIGWTIADGQALGWTPVPVNTSTSFIEHEYRPKFEGTPSPDPLPSESHPHTIYDTVSPYVPPNIYVTKLTVQGLGAFIDDPSSFVICTRVGSDLIWYDNHVTRGNQSSTDINYPAFDTPGEAPSMWRAVLSPEGNTSIPGGNTLSGTDSLERALNFSVSAPQPLSPAIASVTPRSISLFLRASVTGAHYGFTKQIQRFGNSSEVTMSGSSVRIEGEEASDFTKAQIYGFDPGHGTRGTNDQGVIQIKASNIVLKNLYFNQFNDSDEPGGIVGYVLDLQAYSVTLENCVFGGSVQLQADVIRIKNCNWIQSRDCSFAATVGSAAVTSYAAQNLRLIPFGTLDMYGNANKIDWEVSGCKMHLTLFPKGVGYLTSPYSNNPNPRPPGQACVILDLTTDGKVIIKENLFDGAAGQDAPTIHINGTLSDLFILNNEFIGAVGSSAEGNDASIGSSPFNGNYKGAPLLQPIASRGIVATAYISSVVGRGFFSKTVVKNNYFDFTNIGGAGQTAFYAKWGAFICMPNALTHPSTACVYANIEYCQNTHIMSNDNGSGWDPGVTPLPAVWGFYIAPSLQDGNMAGLILQSILVDGNEFDIGGSDNSSAPILQRTWRGIFAADANNWPAGGVGYLTDTTKLIGFNLKNITVPGPVMYTNRSGTGILVSNNKITQRTGAAAPLSFGGIACADFTNPRQVYWTSFIWVTNGDDYNNPSPTLGVGGVFPSSSGFLAPRILGNDVLVPLFTASVDPTTHFASPAHSGGVVMGAISVFNQYRAKIQGNTVIMDNTATYNAGIVTYDGGASTFGYGTHITGNTILSNVAIKAPTTGQDYMSDNIAKGSVGFCTSIITNTYDGTTDVGDNFLA